MPSPVEEKNPRRRLGRWLRLFGLAVGVLLVVGIGAYWYWGSRIGQQLANERAALKAAGEPVTAADLIPPHVPDDQNAALLLRQAAQTIDESTETWRSFHEMRWPDTGTTLPLTDEAKAVLQGVVDENAAVFPLVEQAVRRSQFDWKIDYTADIANVDLVDLTQQRRLANLLQAAALLAHERSDDAQAVEHVLQIRFIARAVGTQPTLISGLVSTGINAMHALTLGELAPTLAISGADPKAVAPAEARAIIAELLNDDSARDVLRRGFRGERAFQQGMTQDLLDGTLITTAGDIQLQQNARAMRAFGFLFRPVIRENQLLMVRHMNRMISGLDAPDWPTFQSQVPRYPVEPHTYRYFWVTLLQGGLGRAPQTYYRLSIDRALAAAALAVRWYAVEHDGALPESLADLVPQYLPHVPLDRLAANGKTIGYVNDPSRPRVYHVGDNGIDDGGREPDPDASEYANRHRTDRVLHLKHQPQPATDDPQRD